MLAASFAVTADLPEGFVGKFFHETLVGLFNDPYVETTGSGAHPPSHL
jgi:hypothetical protein